MFRLYGESRISKFFECRLGQQNDSCFVCSGINVSCPFSRPTPGGLFIVSAYGHTSAGELPCALSNKLPACIDNDTVVRERIFREDASSQNQTWLSFDTLDYFVSSVEAKNPTLQDRRSRLVLVAYSVVPFFGFAISKDRWRNNNAPCLSHF